VHGFGENSTAPRAYHHNAMKLRAKLALAFLMLAVLPLGAIVFYSYVSSEKAFRKPLSTGSAPPTCRSSTRWRSCPGGLRRACLRGSRCFYASTPSQVRWEESL